MSIRQYLMIKKAWNWPGQSKEDPNEKTFGAEPIDKGQYYNMGSYEIHNNSDKQLDKSKLKTLFNSASTVKRVAPTADFKLTIDNDDDKPRSGYNRGNYDIHIKEPYKYWTELLPHELGHNARTKMWIDLLRRKKSMLGYDYSDYVHDKRTDDPEFNKIIRAIEFSSTIQDSASNFLNHNTLGSGYNNYVHMPYMQKAPSGLSSYGYTDAKGVKRLPTQAEFESFTDPKVLSYDNPEFEWDKAPENPYKVSDEDYRVMARDAMVKLLKNPEVAKAFRSATTEKDLYKLLPFSDYSSRATPEDAAKGSARNLLLAFAYNKDRFGDKPGFEGSSWGSRLPDFFKALDNTSSKNYAEEAADIAVKDNTYIDPYVYNEFSNSKYSKEYADYVKANEDTFNPKSDQDRFLEAQIQWLRDNSAPSEMISHAARGMVTDKSTGRLVPYAVNVALDERKRKPKEFDAKREAMFKRLQQAQYNPKYYDIMKKWLVTPYADNMYDAYTDPLMPMEQMDAVMRELDSADRAQSVENTEQFDSGYNNGMFSA